MRYQLKTLKDVFDKVPADRIKACMNELAIGMRQAKAMGDLLGATASHIAGQDIDCTPSWPEEIEWIDDGNGEVALKFQGNNGDDLLDFMVKLEKEADEICGLPR